MPSTVLCATALAVATTAALAAPDPTDPRAAVPPAVYRSAFEGYRPYAPQSPGPWKQANDEVGRIGGFRAYAKEAQAPDPKPDAPAPAHHHHGHGGARHD